MKLVRVSSLWCTSCIVTYKEWKKVKEKYPEYEYIEYDYDEDFEEVEKYNIGNILPVIIIFKNDLEVKRIIGEKKPDELLKEVEALNEKN